MAVEILIGDACEILPGLLSESVQCVVTSPPYFGLRDYGVAGQVGLECGPAEYISRLVLIFREVRRVLREGGTLWLNVGDSFATTGGGRRYGSTDGKVGRASAPGRARRPPEGMREKNLLGIPWRLALALQEDGWNLRCDIIWAKPNPVPESVKDRPVRSHEYIFLLTKSSRYYFDSAAQREESADGGTRTGRSVWSIATKPFREAHFATFPPDLAERCIKAGSRRGDLVLDPFGGAGTTALVADRLGRRALMIELNPEFAEIAKRRIAADAGMFGRVEMTDGEKSSREVAAPEGI